MKEIYVYIAVKGDLYSTLITEQGDTISQKTERTKSDDKSTVIRAMITALSSIIQYINDSMCKIVFVVPNNYIEKWLKNGYSKTEYKEEFDTLYELFQSVPMQYSFSNNIHNKAVTYLKDNNIVKPKVSGASSLLDSFSED